MKFLRNLSERLAGNPFPVRYVAQILRFQNLKFPFKALTVALVPQKSCCMVAIYSSFHTSGAKGGHRKAAGIVQSSSYMLLPLEMKFNIECAPHNKLSLELEVKYKRSPSTRILIIFTIPMSAPEAVIMRKPTCGWEKSRRVDKTSRRE